MRGYNAGNLRVNRGSVQGYIAVQGVNKMEVNHGLERINRGSGQGLIVVQYAGKPRQQGQAIYLFL